MTPNQARTIRIAIFGALLGWAGVAWAGTLAEADELYRAGKYEQAARELTELALRDPTDASLYDRLAAARYRAGDFEGAARAWDQAARLRGGDADAWYNSGNANYRAGRLEEALDRYDQVLAKDPDHQRAAQNKELLVKELERRRQEEPPPPPQQGEGQDQQQNPSPNPQPQPSGQGDAQQPQDPSQPQSGQPSESQTEGQGSGGQPGEPGPEDGSGVADLEDLQPSDGEREPQPGGQGQSSGYEGADPITAGEAHRLLDGIEEGDHRVRIGGQQGGKPW